MFIAVAPRYHNVDGFIGPDNRPAPSYPSTRSTAYESLLPLNLRALDQALCETIFPERSS